MTAARTDLLTDEQFSAEKARVLATQKDFGPGV